MDSLQTGNRWTPVLAAIGALLVIVVLTRATPPRSLTAPPDALRDPRAPLGLSGQFERQPQPTISAPVPVAGHTPVLVDRQLALYTSDGSYSADQVRALAQPLNEALNYVSQRTAMQFQAPVTVIFDRRDSCGLDGAAYTQQRTIVLYACPDTPPNRAVNILAHEFVHQLANDHYGAAHLHADLILSEGLATWGAGKYWLGGESDFRGFVLHQYASHLLPLGSHYRDFGTVDAMNRLYYQWASLVDFLITTRGRETFDRLYISGHGMEPNTADYAGILGADLSGTEEQWQAWLNARD